LFVAEYLTRGHSLPFPEPPREFQGALTKLEQSGVFHDVRHVDVRSLYPSILLAEQAAPARDELKVFPRLLESLRRFRLAAKDAERSAATPAARRDAGALQSAFKILINSFYGYLGFPQGSFNDYELAAHVTRRGREILGAMLDKLAALGAAVIEADTDGGYFQMPEAADEAAFDAALRAVLPPGIEGEFDAAYPAMFAYKSKNYALLKADGAVALTGAALKSRALEPFQRDFILRAVTALLRGVPHEIGAYYRELGAAIAEHRLPLEKFAKTEVLNDSPEAYRRKLESGAGRHSAAYDLVLASPRTYRAGDRVRFYVTGTQRKPKLTGNTRLLEDADGSRDENTAFYLDKLDALYQNYQPFIPSGGEKL
ncbi:MAG: DNA polymerase II, partial [Lentisphaeria bacterium]|nr:DNA polymerase II [Lentisphaeria bacterium]